MSIITNYLRELHTPSQIYSYTDNKGIDHSWDVNDVWKHTKDKTFITIPTKNFILDEDLWFGGYQIPSPDNILVHMKRVLKANLMYPILLDSTFVKPNDSKIKHGIIDGAHRILKYKFNDIPKVKCIIVNLDEIQEYKK